MLEHVILVDEMDRQVGVSEKLRAHREGARHRAFSVFVFDDLGRLLLQRRALGKYHSGGLWSNSACGHPRPGESVLDAGRRRLREEMGIDCALESLYHFSYTATFTNGLTEHEIDHVLVGRHAGPINPDPGEAESWDWIEKDRVVTSVRANPEAYTYWFRAAIDEVQLRLGDAFR